MKEVQNYLTNNDCYKAGVKMGSIKGVMVHSTATPGATTESFVKSWNTSKPNGRNVCVHAFIDNKQVVNTLPYNIKCWGCGSGNKGSGNNNYIQIEICEPSEVYYKNGWEYQTKDSEATKKYLDTVINGLIDWIVVRLKELKITEVNTTTVTSHYEAYRLGIASNHSDPEGLLKLGGYDMNMIRALVKNRINNSNKTENKQEVTSNKQEVTNNKQEGYLVKITTDALNIRSGPGTSHAVVGCIRDRGTYTIVATQGTWGQLKSGAGWISLNYTSRI